MSRRPVPSPAEALELANRFAALSGAFRPEDALVAARASGLGAKALAALASTLSRSCDTRQEAGEARWILRAVERKRVLDSHDDTAFARALDWREKQACCDTAARDLIDAARGVDDFAEAKIADLLNDIAGTPAPDRRQTLARIATALERISLRSASTEQYRQTLAQVWIALGSLDDAPRAEATQTAFVGRAEECARIAHWIAAPQPEPPVRLLLITGAAGTGKSTLLEHATRLACSGSEPPVLVRLDFDRAGLDMLDPTGLTLEVARQVGAHLPAAAADIRAARVAAAGSGRDLRTRGERPDDLPPELATALRDAIARAKPEARPVLIALDTVEALRSAGDTHPQRLFEWLDGLFAIGLGPLAVVAAGRSDAFDTVPERLGAPGETRMTLAGFPPDQITPLLAAFGAPDGTEAAITALAEDSLLLQRLSGNPLMLRLLVELAKTSGVEAIAEHGERAVATAMLGRILLSRLPDPDLRALARPGLVVRWLSPHLVAEALAPGLGLSLKGNSPAEHLAHAERLVAMLSRQHWLFETREGKPWIRMRPEARHVLLPLLYLDNPARCACADRAAAAWFEQQSEDWARSEAAYHRLQLSRAEPYDEVIDASLAQWFGEKTLEDLPAQARQALPQTGPADASEVIVTRKWDAIDATTVDPSAAVDLRTSMERSDWAEAAAVYRLKFEGRTLDAQSDAADAARSFLWRTGRWVEAHALLLAAGQADDADIGRLRLLDAVVRLEMRAEFEFGHLVERLRDADAGAHLRAAVARIPLCGTAFDLTLGALGFCLEAAGVPRPVVASQVADPVGAALDLWSRAPSAAQAHVRITQAVAIANDQRTARGFAPLLPDAAMLGTVPVGIAWSETACARAIAALSPYGSALEHAVRADPAEDLAQDAISAFRALEGEAGPWFGLKAETTPPLTNPIAALRDVGLLAEWAGLAAAYAKSEEVRLIAQAAERLRRTAAGLWAYAAPPPPAWRGAEGEDVLLRRALDVARQSTDLDRDSWLWVRALELSAETLEAAPPPAAPMGDQVQSETRGEDDDRDSFA
ncbi:AAA family ATPase [Xanthobacteraceae bacterium A53D]